METTNPGVANLLIGDFVGNIRNIGNAFLPSRIANNEKDDIMLTELNLVEQLNHLNH